LRFKWGFIGADKQVILGDVQKVEMQTNTILGCRNATLDAAVVMLKSGKAGLNLQGMSWMVSLAPIPIASDETQAKGIRSMVPIYLGRCNRFGQQKRTRWYMLNVAYETHDRTPILQRDMRISQAEALTRIDPNRAAKKTDRRKEVDKDRDNSQPQANEGGLESLVETQ
jgi:hypothetical protein